MDDDDPNPSTTSYNAKGKAKAKPPEATERTPLLSSTSTSARGVDDDGVHNAHLAPLPHQRLFRRLLWVFTITLCFCIILFIIVLIIGYSYVSRVSNMTPDEILQRGLVFEGPDRVDVLDVVGEGNLLVQIDGRVGLDAGGILEINSSDGDLVWKSLWKSLGRWGVATLGKVSVDMSPTTVTSSQDRWTVLTTLQSSPIQISLTTNAPSDRSWLTPVSTTVLVSPTNNISALVGFARDSWTSGRIDIVAAIPSVAVKGGGLSDKGWRRMLHLVMKNVLTETRVKIPPLPGLPIPGRNTPFPSILNMVTVKRLSVFSEFHRVSIDVSITFVDPAPERFTFTAPSLSFIASIPCTDDSVSRKLLPVAAVDTSAFSLTHPNVTLDINGHILPIAPSSSSALSSFITSYLNAHPLEISVSSPLFPSLTFDTVVPVPHRPKILRNVTIKDMKIKASASGTMSTSGVVYGLAVLPKGLDVGMNITRVFPELLVFDGLASDNIRTFNDSQGDSADIPDRMPIPEPPPERAFAHFRPEMWLESLSAPTDRPEDAGSAVLVSAKFVDVPLEVLPGRQREFRDFVRKVIFGSGGALAGINGLVAVCVRVEGLPLDQKECGMEVHGIPFEGEVRVGKTNIFSILEVHHLLDI